jgi:hypothetical protein
MKHQYEEVETVFEVAPAPSLSPMVMMTDLFTQPREFDSPARSFVPNPLRTKVRSSFDSSDTTSSLTSGCESMDEKPRTNEGMLLPKLDFAKLKSPQSVSMGIATSQYALGDDNDVFSQVETGESDKLGQSDDNNVDNDDHDDDDDDDDDDDELHEADHLVEGPDVCTFFG